jgi:hypothetical protein
MVYRAPILVGAVIAIVSLASTSSLAQPSHGPSKYAILVGCTKYESSGIPELWGPANDIPLWQKTLEQAFGFSKDHISALVGWPDAPERRPTRANIAHAVEELIGKAGPSDQVVIVLSGHGAQVPVPNDNDFRTNPEPDGLDEVFLPADVKSWVPTGVENAIKDDEIGSWLDRLREKGADVWIIFDCCHSGTMTRGAQSRERSRSVRPFVLGVPDQAIADASRRAQADSNQSAADSGVVPPRRGTGRTGSLVAFYAAQPFEESPELPRPDDAAQLRENYYGLFTYTLTAALTQRGSPLTYRELSQIVGSRYRSERKSRPPTAFVEGELDREVLGLRTWPHRSDILLSREGAAGTLSISAGELHGLVSGSVLAVHPPAGDARRPEEVLGFVEVVEPGPTSARAIPIAFDRDKAVDLAAIPDQARGEVVARGVGDLRVKYSVIADTPFGTMIRAAIAALAEEVRNQVCEVDDPAKADFWLRGANGRVQLIQGQGNAPLAKGAALGTVNVPNGTTREKPQEAEVLFEEYSAEPGDRLTAGLERDFQKIFRWQNLWRVTGALGNNPPPGRDLGLRIEVKVLSGPGDRNGRLLENRPVLRPGQWIEVRVVNDGKDDLWVTLLALDSRFGIQDIPVVSIPAKKGTSPERFEVTADSFGPEGLVALAYPIDAQRERPRFDFFIQEPLGRPDAERSKGLEKSKGLAPKTPFGELMKSAAFGMQTRAIRKQTSTEPQISSSVWVTVPGEGTKPR